MPHDLKYIFIFSDIHKYKDHDNYNLNFRENDHKGIRFQSLN